LPFYRDGVRTLTLSPGIETREVDAIVDAVLAVTAQAETDDDLVTLLWEAQLQHVDVDYVPAEGEVGSSSSEDTSELVPWPTGTVEEDDGSPTTESAAAEAETGSRSDDWATGDLAVEIEAGFAELDSLAESEVPRFRNEYRAEHEVSPVTTALAIARAYLDAGVLHQDRLEFAKFIPRMLRLSITRGAWLEAREALSLLRECGSPDWSVETFTQELLQPISISTTVEHLDRQEPAQIAEFVALAEILGEQAIEMLNLVLAESQQRRTRRLVAEAIAALTREHPERIAPWLSDSRWHVVRNAVHILGWIGGDEVVPLLRPVVRHPDLRVRYEVAAALGQVSPRSARPLLIRLLDGADTRLFCTVLQQLGFEQDKGVARMLLGFMQDASFETRPDAERRAIYTTFSAIADDDVLPELEAELVKAAWLSRTQELHRQAIGRIIARIGTPLARNLLERGQLSKRAAVRKACEDALGGAHERNRAA
jgi:HEAT repeat protein